MTKKLDETLKKTGIEKKKTSLKISRKSNSKTTKKVILETPILEQIPEKKSKRTISRKKPEQKAIGSLNVAKKTNITSPIIEEKKSIKTPEVSPASVQNIEIIDKVEISDTSKSSKNKNTTSIEIEKIEILDKSEDSKISTEKNITSETENLKTANTLETIDELKHKNTNNIKVVNELENKNKNKKAKQKKSNTTLTPNTPMPNSKKNSRVLDNKQILVKPKRTLKLNIGNKTASVEEKTNTIIGFSDIPIVEASPIPKKNVSINQNSSFFYEPSIFEKFNIKVSNLDEDISENIEIKNLENIEDTQNITKPEIPELNKDTIIDGNDTSIIDEQAEIEENTTAQNVITENVDNENSSNETEITENIDIEISSNESETEENINTESASDETKIEENVNTESASDGTEIEENVNTENEAEEIIDNENASNENEIAEYVDTEITSVENEVDENINIENSSDEIETEKNVEEELINALLDELIEEQLSEQKSEQENFDFVSNEIPEELKETFEKNQELSAKKQKFIEDASSEYDFISTETPDIYKPYFSSNNLDLSDEITYEDIEGETISENIEKEIIDEKLDSNSNISIDDIDVSDTIFDEDNTENNIEDISNIENTNLLEVDFTKKEIELVEHNEAADNLITDEILKETQEKADDTAIGKFFDSSIPSMSQETDASYFTKIKKSLFSNISTVFKKFSYEEASLLKSEKEILEDASPIIELSKPSSPNEIKQVLENFDNNENTINNLEVSASQNTLVLPTIDEKVLEAKEISTESVQDVFTNIVTSPTAPTDDISLDDIDLNDIDISDLELSDIENILDKTTEANNTENIENQENSDISDIENEEKLEVGKQTSDILKELYSGNEENENLENVEELEINSSELDETSNSEELDENLISENFEELDETLEDDFYSQFTEQNDEINNKPIDEIENEIENLSEEDIDEELNEVLGIEPEETNEDEEQFSIEEYFGVTPKEPEDDDDDDFIEEFEDDDMLEDEQPNIYQEQIDSFSKLIENFTQTISNLSDKITELENNITTSDTSSPIEQTEICKELLDDTLDNPNESLTIENNSNDNINDGNINNNLNVNNENISDNTTIDTIEENSEIDLEDISIDDISLDDISLEDLEALEETTDIEEPSLLPIQDEIESQTQDALQIEAQAENSIETQNEVSENTNSVEDILLKAFDNPEINDQMKHDLLSEVLSVEDELTTSIENTSTPIETETTSDFFKIIDSLSKTISELEKAPDFVQESSEKTELEPTFVQKENNEVVTTSSLSEKEPESTHTSIIEEETTTVDEVAPVPENTSDKAINILINKDDIFSIAILNETYEIVTDFDGISVISENIHISTPKNNFYVNIGEKYIEIHKQPDLFVVNTNFEDIEFANAINNVTFAKKKNKIELNIKAAFKISSVNKKIELSMLNTSIANLTGSQENSDDNSSICDNKTLVINEETQKVYLPYTIEEVMKKLNNSSDYQSLEDVIEQEYTLPLSTFKMPIISRFKEAYRFMRTKEKSSVYAALDLAVELMFNSNLNPAVIRASKDLKELNIYLDCLYENELEKFDCFKVIYKVLPKIQ